MGSLAKYIKYKKKKKINCFREWAKMLLSSAHSAMSASTDVREKCLPAARNGKWTYLSSEPSHL